MDFNITNINRLKDINENMNILWGQMGNISIKTKMIEKEHMEILESTHTI